MLRHVAEPLHAGGLETDVGVEAAGDGAVDNSPLLLVQQLNQPLLGTDVTLGKTIDSGEPTLYRPLLTLRRNGRADIIEIVRV